MTGEPGANGAPHPSTDERAQGKDVLGLGERERDCDTIVHRACPDAAPTAPTSRYLARDTASALA